LKLFIVGYYGFQNTGDDVMLYCILEQIYSDGIKISVLNCDPVNVPESIQGKVKIIPLSVMAGLREFIKTNIIIIGGGTHLFSHGSFFQSLKINARILLLASAARITGKQFHLLNIGVGGYDNKVCENIGRLVCLLANKIIVRDTASWELLKTWGIKSIYSPDISVLYE